MKEYLNKENYHYIRLICGYTIVLDIVYSYWCYKSDLPWWVILIVAIGFLLVGGLIELFYINHTKKIYENSKKDDTSSIEDNNIDATIN